MNIVKKLWNAFRSFAIEMAKFAAGVVLIGVTVAVWFGAISLPLAAFERGHPLLGIVCIPLAVAIMFADSLTYQFSMSWLNPDWPGDVDTNFC